MRSLKTLIASGVITALAVSALAVPASAATKGQAVIVNGIPNKKIDICIGKTEIRSNLKYGGVFKKSFEGKKLFKFRKASAGACKGQLLAFRTVKFPGGSSKTVVVTSKSPDRVLVFDNTDLASKVGATSADGALAIRHAGDLTDNMVHFWNQSWSWDGTEYNYEPSALSAVNDFTKGSQKISKALVPIDEDVANRIKAYRSDDTTLLAKSSIFEVKAQKRYEFIFIGRWAGNARVVKIVSPL